MSATDPNLLYSEIAEQSVLSAIISNDNTIMAISGVLEPEAFYLQPHALIYSLCINLDRDSKAIDSVSLINGLSNLNQLSACGGEDYILWLAEQKPALQNIQEHVKIIKEKQTLRQIGQLANTLSKAVLEGVGKNTGTLLSETEEKITQLQEKATTNKKTLVKVKNILPAVIKAVEDAYDNPNRSPVTGLRSGFEELDHMTCGFEKSDMIVLAARPGMGKTALALNFAEHCSCISKMPVAFFSLEMSSEQLVRRLLSAMSGVDFRNLRTGNINTSEWAFLEFAAQRIQQAPLYIDDEAGLTYSEIRSRARTLNKRTGGLGLIVIDYLQLITPSNRLMKSETHDQVAEVSRSIKALAKELKVPIIVLSQLNRELEKRMDKRPQMSDLRGSGQIEQDADLILFVYRDEIYNKNGESKGLAEIIVGKQRNGAVGTINLKFDENKTKFI